MLEKNSEDVSTEKDILPFRMGYLPERFQEKLPIITKETPENKITGLQMLKELIKNDKDFDDIEFDDDFLRLFLRCEEYNIKFSFGRLKNVLNLKKDHPYMFENQLYENTSISFTKNIVTLLPYRCPDGCAIFHINLDNWIPEEFPVIEVKRMAPIVTLQPLRDPMTQVNGFKAILNCKSNPIRHLRHCTPQNLYLLYHGCQNCLPARIHSYHIVNPSITSRVCIEIMKHFFTEELKRKVS
ncbi:alpha-tocopherol transfer protein-like [Trichonephila inaurata madagascariensis]|uniref:Alpha-tocopherol transfer protein-like n=1 Tax=Trichonephila inaurata madagascariensis TaxID=2747483 RepID=A0A8X7CL59_9ARAC|nr:alpha-tocopherol transfer protein-like [Trichonephila inaurata madagascariensis]